MSTSVVEFVQQQEQFFTPVIADEKITFAKESQFAVQAIQRNDYLGKIAFANQESFKNAIINVAAIGISLNPAQKHAYLVPRDGAVHLDISYMGLLHLAQSTGSILWGQCKLVYSNDTYENQGLDKAPIHSYNPFGDRGEIVGGYCTVKTPLGDYLTEEMRLSQIKEVEAVSKARKGPWQTFWGEMARKTIVKRASKYWPNVERLDKAIHYLNENGEGVETSPEMAYYSEDIKQQEEKEITEDLKQQLDDFAFQMDNAETEHQLKTAFNCAYNLTRKNASLNQQAQKIYVTNKNRLGIK